MSPAHHYFRLWLVALLGFLGLAGFINFAIDPLQVFRRASFYVPHFSENQRYQTPGLANHYAQPIVVLGTSHMENASPAEISAAYGEPGLKLAISGSSLKEQQLALRLALRTGKVKRVFWGIDDGALAWGDRFVEEWGEFPVYLYEPDPRLISRYLLSLQTLQEGWTSITQAPPKTLETLNIWWPNAQFSPERVAAAWEFQERQWKPEMRDIVADAARWDKLVGVLERRVAETIRAHPEIHFDLVLPPYSILGYANDFRLSDAWFFQRVLLREGLRQLARTEKNVHLWDFQTELALSTDFKRYKDLYHYDLEMTRMMLRRVARDQPHKPDAQTVDPLPKQVADFLRPHCQGQGNAAYCTAYIRCGASRLDAWLESGGAPERALEFAQRPCPG